ncbi:MAG: DUF3332 family protein [Psychromonas sp.]
MMKVMNKKMVKVVAAAALASTLSGCVGSNAVTEKLMIFNLEAVDNRYGRGGLNILMAPIYAITVGADYLIFNSIEFWSGKNPLNGKPHIFDTKTDTYFDINDDLDPSLKDAPLDPISRVDNSDKSIYSAQAVPVNDNTIDYNIVYTNGDTAVLRGEKQDQLVSFYMDGELITVVSMTELEQYSADNKA